MDSGRKNAALQQRGEQFKLFQQSVNGDSQPIPVPTDGRPAGGLGAVTPDGQWVAVHAQMPRTFQIDMIPLVPDKKIYTFLAPNGADVRNLSFSSDGNWAAIFQMKQVDTNCMPLLSQVTEAAGRFQRTAR